MFATQNYKDAILACDTCPLKPDPTFVSLPEVPEMYDISLPFATGSTDVHQYMMLPDHQAIDYANY